MQDNYFGVGNWSDLLSLGLKIFTPFILIDKNLLVVCVFEAGQALWLGVDPVNGSLGTTPGNLTFLTYPNISFEGRI